MVFGIHNVIPLVQLCVDMYWQEKISLLLAAMSAILNISNRDNTRAGVQF